MGSFIAASEFWHSGFSLDVACRLSCPSACGILVPWPGIEPLSPVFKSGFLTTGLPGSPSNSSLFIPPLRPAPPSLHAVFVAGIAPFSHASFPLHLRQSYYCTSSKAEYGTFSSVMPSEVSLSFSSQISSLVPNSTLLLNEYRAQTAMQHYYLCTCHLSYSVVAFLEEALLFILSLLCLLCWAQHFADRYWLLVPELISPCLPSVEISFYSELSSILSIFSRSFHSLGKTWKGKKNFLPWSCVPLFILSLLNILNTRSMISVFFLCPESFFNHL